MYRGYSAGTQNTRTPNNDFTAVMARIQACYKKNQLQLLMFLIDLCSKNYSQIISKTKISDAKIDQNLNMLIFEKCSLIKAKNQQLKTMALNVQATLSKQYCNSRKTHYDKKYQEILQNIREKSYSIRQKIAKFKKQEISHSYVTNISNEKTKTVIINLQKATEQLSHETIKVKTEFDSLMETLPQYEQVFN